MGILDRDTPAGSFSRAGQKAIQPETSSSTARAGTWKKCWPPAQMMTQAERRRHRHRPPFNDGIRDNIKGDAGPRGNLPASCKERARPTAASSGFGSTSRAKARAGAARASPWRRPNETINYASVHDEPLPLGQVAGPSAPTVPENVRISMDKLAAGIVAHGPKAVPFIHEGGRVLCAPKTASANSYNNNDPRGQPARLVVEGETTAMSSPITEGLIALRKAPPRAFRLTDKSRRRSIPGAGDPRPGKPRGLFSSKTMRMEIVGKPSLSYTTGPAQTRDLTVNRQLDHHRQRPARRCRRTAKTAKKPDSTSNPFP